MQRPTLAAGPGGMENVCALEMPPSFLHLETGDPISPVVENQGAASVLTPPTCGLAWLLEKLPFNLHLISHHLINGFPKFPPQTLHILLPAHLGAGFYIFPFTAKTEI